MLAYFIGREALAVMAILGVSAGVGAEDALPAGPWYLGDGTLTPEARGADSLRQTLKTGVQ